MQEAIQRLEVEYKRITYWDQDNKNQKNSIKTPYIIPLSDALTYLDLESIDGLHSPAFILLQDTYFKNPLYNFKYATSDMDQDGHYIYGIKKGVETLYFTIQGLKYFSLIYPSPNRSMIALYYINLESKYLRFERDADGFLS
jgi:hypothetical protein